VERGRKKVERRGRRGGEETRESRPGTGKFEGIDGQSLKRG
jgi:hypothetical protein